MPAGTLPRALLFMAGAVAACATLAVAIQALLVWLAPELGHLIFFVVGISFSVGPWLLLAYMAASQRFGLGWHWALAAVASLLALEGGRFALSSVMDIQVLTGLFRSSCPMPSDAPLPQLQSTAFVCALASWGFLATAMFLRAIAAGILLAAVAWIFARLRAGRALR